MPPLKYFVPNSFTALSLVVGLGSIVQSVRGDFELAAWMILWATLLDKADGSVARLFKATSNFGVEFDSFADFVAFGIAPSALIYFQLVATPTFSGWFGTALALSCAWYTVALAIRLARFNTMTDSGDTEFVGIPGTLLGALVGTAFLTWHKHGGPQILLDYAPAYLAIGGALMISNLRLPKLKPRKNLALNLFQFGNIAVAYICGPLRLFPEYLFGLAVTYTVGGVGWCLLHPPSQSAESDDEPQEQLA